MLLRLYINSNNFQVFLNFKMFSEKEIVAIKLLNHISCMKKKDLGKYHLHFLSQIHHDQAKF